MSWKELNKEMDKIEHIVESLDENPTQDDVTGTEEDEKMSEEKTE